MKIKSYVVILMASAFVFKANGQASPDTHLSTFLTIGDTIPNLTFRVENHPEPTVSLRGISGKLVILDFWSTTCLPCIQAIPKMNELQDRFKDSIKVILVTTDNHARVDAFRSRSSILQENRLPSIVGDSILQSLFSIATLPTHVWIGGDGRIMHITNGYNTTGARIAKFLSTGTTDLPQKKEYADIDFKQPLYAEGNGRHLDKFLFHSYLTRRIETGTTLKRVARSQKTRKVNQIKAINVSALNLFQLVHGRAPSNIFDRPNRFQLDVSDKRRFLPPTNLGEIDRWADDNMYCYELVADVDDEDAIFELMHAELDDYFHVNSFIRKVRLPCWVITVAGDVGKLQTSGKKKLLAPNIALGNTAHIQNATMDEATQLIEKIITYNLVDPLPLLNESGVDFAVDMDVPNDFSDIRGLREVLQGYGLTILRKQRRVPVLIIEDK